MHKINGIYQVCGFLCLRLVVFFIGCLAEKLKKSPVIQNSSGVSTEGGMGAGTATKIAAVHKLTSLPFTHITQFRAKCEIFRALLLHSLQTNARAVFLLCASYVSICVVSPVKLVLFLEQEQQQ